MRNIPLYEQRKQTNAMQRLIENIKAFTGEVTFESLKQFIDGQDFSKLKYEKEIPQPEQEGDYGRNILSMQPFECVLLNWPAGIGSAVHQHKGLFGYVLVLDGHLDNVSYRMSDDRLEEYAIDSYKAGSLIPEPDGVIHKLVNHSENQRALSLHFYYPAIKSFENMCLYDLGKKAIGVLSDKAITASWQHTEGHFKKIKENAFQYIPYGDLK